MGKDELIKKLEELRDVKDYSYYELTNKGYREGLLDALDLVNEYFDLALVSQQRELFVSFARFAHNYGKGSYGTSYEEMFTEWLQKKPNKCKNTRIEPT